VCVCVCVCVCVYAYSYSLSGAEGETAADVPASAATKGRDDGRGRAFGTWPKVDMRALGVAVEPPPAASHPPPDVPYNSPDRGCETEDSPRPCEGPTEDPFHARQNQRLATVGLILQGNS
jgi:hypothetical protein